MKTFAVIGSLLSIAALLSPAFSHGSARPAPPQYDLLIRNGRVLRGPGYKRQ